MKPMISEFSYGYALTEELARGIVGRLIGAPIFPSLYQEGQPGGGYDVQLPRRGAPLFLQFKLSHYMNRSTAAEWDAYSSPYYRIYLRARRHSSQHDLLQQWEARGYEVYYAAPIFHTSEELDAAYRTRLVFDKSAFFRPNDIGPLPDDDEHYVVFHPFERIALFCSGQRRKIPPPLIGADFQQHYLLRLGETKRDIDKSFFDEITRSFISVLHDWQIRPDALKGIEDQLVGTRQSVPLGARLAAHLSRIYLDAEMVVTAQSEDR